jgi:hypothetical protein
MWERSQVTYLTGAQKEGSSVNKVNNEQRGELAGQKSSEGVDSMGLGKALGTMISILIDFDRISEAWICCQ